MTHSALYGIQIIGFLILALFQKGEVEITHDPPESMNPADEVVVTVNIDKSDVQGFAKFQITLGEGLSAEVVESGGASFTFNNGKAKFIWMALPKNDEFSLKYRIVSTGAASGKMAVDSRFSYIYDNERKNYDLPTHYVTIGTEGGAAEEEMAEEVAPMTNEEAEISVARTISSDGLNQWKVNLEIEKNGLGGFGKVEEKIPEGYTAIDLKSSGAVFSSENDIVKYIWYDIPENETVTLTYKLLPVVAQNGEEPIIEGGFSYLENDETVEIPIYNATMALAETAEKDTTGAEVTEMAEIEEEPEDSGEPEDLGELEEPEEISPEAETIAEAEHAAPITAEPPAEPETAETAKKEIIEEPTPPKKTAVDANIVDVPEPQEGVFYRVQLAAGKNNLEREVFEKIYNFTEGFNIEPHRGWIKYTTGYHQVYKSARDDRERITGKYAKFQGPFVTAYNSGERISVQEALMITDQRWFP